MAAEEQKLNSVTVENLQEQDLAEADHIFRLAFGTFIGVPDPASFHQGADYVRTRWTADPAAAFAAKVQGKLVGTNFATNWGSVGFFGPLTIHPDYWDRGVGKRLIEPVVDLFSRWGVKQAGLYTFAQSQKHVALYQKFGFWPRFLTAIMSLRVDSAAGAVRELQTYSELSPDAREQALEYCCELTNQVYEGLDVSREVRAITNQNLGETVLVWDDSRLVGFAACHCGEGSEAGPDVCYVKFAAVRPSTNGPDASGNFNRLLSACETLAARRGLARVLAGVNTARTEAYQQMMRRGFKTEMQGVAMHSPNEPGYSQPGVFVLDDWR
ncbi:MAG TPA: GNAT family N-acetyltransferase [Blastocatellia bacterium]|nr:GNAT family N-acetyltransferase [Blastocatellia bacterium]